MQNTKFHKNHAKHLLANYCTNTETSSKTGDLRLETHIHSGEHLPLSFSQKDEIEREQKLDENKLVLSATRTPYQKSQTREGIE